MWIKSMWRNSKDISKIQIMDVGDATSTTSMDVVKVGLEKQVGLELEGIQGWKNKNFFEK